MPEGRPNDPRPSARPCRWCRPRSKAGCRPLAVCRTHGFHSPTHHRCPPAPGPAVVRPGAEWAQQPCHGPGGGRRPEHPSEWHRRWQLPGRHLPGGRGHRRRLQRLLPLPPVRHPPGGGGGEHRQPRPRQRGRGGDPSPGHLPQQAAGAERSGKPLLAVTRWDLARPWRQLLPRQHLDAEHSHQPGPGPGQWLRRAPHHAGGSGRPERDSRSQRHSGPLPGHAPRPGPAGGRAGGARWGPDSGGALPADPDPRIAAAGQARGRQPAFGGPGGEPAGAAPRPQRPAGERGPTGATGPGDPPDPRHSRPAGRRHPSRGQRPAGPLGAGGGGIAGSGEDHDRGPQGPDPAGKHGARWWHQPGGQPPRSPGDQPGRSDGARLPAGRGGHGAAPHTPGPSPLPGRSQHQPRQPAQGQPGSHLPAPGPGQPGRALAGPHGHRPGGDQRQRAAGGGAGRADHRQPDPRRCQRQSGRQHRPGGPRHRLRRRHSPRQHHPLGPGRCRLGRHPPRQCGGDPVERQPAVRGERPCPQHRRPHHRLGEPHAFQRWRDHPAEHRHGAADQRGQQPPRSAHPYPAGPPVPLSFRSTHRRLHNSPRRPRRR